MFKTSSHKLDLWKETKKKEIYKVFLSEYAAMQWIYILQAYQRICTSGKSHRGQVLKLVQAGSKRISSIALYVKWSLMYIVFDV